MGRQTLSICHYLHVGYRGWTEVVIMWFMTSPKSVRLKDKDFYGKSPNVPPNP